MKAVVAAFNQEKALVGTFSVITNLRMDLFQALAWDHWGSDDGGHRGTVEEGSRVVEVVREQVMVVVVVVVQEVLQQVLVVVVAGGGGQVPGEDALIVQGGSPPQPGTRGIQLGQYSEKVPSRTSNTFTLKNQESRITIRHLL